MNNAATHIYIVEDSAAIRARLHEIPVIVREATDGEALELVAGRLEVHDGSCPANDTKVRKRVSNARVAIE